MFCVIRSGKIGERHAETIGALTYAAVLMIRDYRNDVGIEFVKVPALIRRQLAVTYEHLRHRQQPPTALPRLRPVLIGGQWYRPSLTYEGVPRSAWHLIVQAEGVPCFAQRFDTATEAVAAWKTFRQGRESSVTHTRRARARA